MCEALLELVAEIEHQTGCEDAVALLQAIGLVEED